jgi:hypothetical protein
MSVLIAIIFILISLLLLASGLAIVFIYFPRWLVHRYELTTERKTIAYFAFAGLLVPTIFTCKYLVTHTEMITDALFLWPTALILMDLTGHPSVVAIVANFAFAILSNVGLYAWVGVFVAWIRRKYRKNNLEA